MSSDAVAEKIGPNRKIELGGTAGLQKERRLESSLPAHPACLPHHKGSGWTAVHRAQSPFDCVPPR